MVMFCQTYQTPSWLPIAYVCKNASSKAPFLACQSRQHDLAKQDDHAY